MYDTFPLVSIIFWKKSQKHSPFPKDQLQIYY